MAKPRVLKVLRPAEGGIRAHVSNLLQYLQDEFSFTVACPPDQADAFRAQGYDVVALPLRRGLHPYYDLQTATGLYRALRSGCYDVVHAHGFKAALLARPVAVYCDTPCLVTVHGDLAHAGNARYRQLYRRAERLLAQRADGYVTVSHWLAGLLINDFNVPAEKIAVIPNGIDFSSVCDSPGGELPFADVPLVGTVARLAPQKGIEYFLYCAAELAGRQPAVRFVVVGDGPLRADLEALCRKLNLGEKVFFAGYRADVPALLRRFDVFVQPSLSEGQGITVLEAMAAGCPVVASAAGGLAEVVQDGENGLLVTPGNTGELAMAVEKLLQSEELCRQLADAGRETAKDYSITEMIDRTRELYRRIMEGALPA